MMEIPLSNDKVQFHLGADWNIKISKRIDQAMESYMAGKPMDWFYNMKGVRFLIGSYLSTEENESLDKLEKSIYKNLKEKNTSELISTVEDYDSELKTYLKKYGFLNPFKQDNTSLF